MVLPRNCRTYVSNTYSTTSHSNCLQETRVHVGDAGNPAQHRRKLRGAVSGRYLSRLKGGTRGLSTLNEDQIAERAARLARRDDREYREYLREEQPSQPGCPAREVVLDERGQATSRRFVSPADLVLRAFPS